MTVYSQHSPAVNSVTASIGLAREEGGYVDLYFSTHLVDTSLGVLPVMMRTSSERG
jgi:hypothetical protein